MRLSVVSITIKEVTLFCVAASLLLVPVYLTFSSCVSTFAYIAMIPTG